MGKWHVVDVILRVKQEDGFEYDQHIYTGDYVKEILIKLEGEHN